MNKEKHAGAARQIRMPDLMESIFDIAYLVYAMFTAVSFYLAAGNAGGSSILLLCGSLALVLGGGDAFHLLPRVRRALLGADEKTEARLGAGLFVSSVTMTVFYLLLYEIWIREFPQSAADIPAIWPALLWLSAILRIVLCFFPQNNWLKKEGDFRWSMARNIPFAVTGLIMAALFFVSGNADGLGMWRMGIAILISFGCYFPVVLFAKKKPMVGMLMIPKTCAYIWMLVLLRQLMG